MWRKLTMFNINGNNIILIRGNSFTCGITIKEGTTPYVPASGDTIVFEMKRSALDDEAVLTKNIDTASLILAFDPEDTEDLDYGCYAISVTLTKAGGWVDTFISGKLALVPADTQCGAAG